jgi:hypothetical protein
MLKAPDLGNEDGATPKEQPPRTPTTRRYTPEEKASAVRMVRAVTSASTAAATSPLCPAPATTASTSPSAALLLLGGTGVLLFGDHRQPPDALTIARRHPRQLHAARYPAQWPGDRDLGHLDTAPAGNVA